MRKVIRLGRFAYENNVSAHYLTELLNLVSPREDSTNYPWFNSSVLYIEPGDDLFWETLLVKAKQNEEIANLESLLIANPWR